MNKLRLRTALAPCLLLPALAAQAAADSATELTACADLAPEQEIIRSSVQRFFIRSGEQYYQVEMAGQCDGLPLSPRLLISTDGQENRLCPAGTRVKTKRGSCNVDRVLSIDAEEFARRKARAGR